MATSLSHGVVAVALGSLYAKDERMPKSFWVAAVFCAALPDVDIIGFESGIRYGDLWGHRGLTHSLLCALIVGIVAAWAIKPEIRTRKFSSLAFIFFLITASHGALDALTNGGLGVAFFSPFDPSRYFFAWRPIEVSPIGARFFSARGVEVLMNEFLWIWIPSLLTIFGARWLYAD